MHALQKRGAIKLDLLNQLDGEADNKQQSAIWCISYPIHGALWKDVHALAEKRELICQRE